VKLTVQQVLIFILLLTLVGCTGTPKFQSTVGVDSPAQINANLGRTYMEHGNFEVAEAKLLRALEQDPKLGAAHHYIAELYRRSERGDLAKDHYQRAMKYEPKDMFLQNNYGVFLCERGEYKEAVEIFVKVANSRDYNRPDDAYANAGLCALGIPDEEMGEAYLRRSLVLNKRQPKVLYNLSKLNYEHKQYLTARAFIERYTGIAPHSSQTLLLAAKIELQMGDRQAAEAYANQLSTEFPDTDENKTLERLLAPPDGQAGRHK